MAEPPGPRHRWHAALYDTLVTRSAGHRLTPLREFIVGGAAGRVLEIGGGTGANLPFYKWDQVSSLVFTEPDPYMLARATAKAEAMPAAIANKISFRQAPAESLPLGNAEFDVVIATLVFCTINDPAAALSQVRRVLKPGGELRLLEHVAPSGAVSYVARAVQPAYAWFAGGCNLSRHTEATIDAAGFDVDVFQRLKLGGLPFITAIARA